MTLSGFDLLSFNLPSLAIFSLSGRLLMWFPCLFFIQAIKQTQPLVIMKLKNLQNLSPIS